MTKPLMPWDRRDFLKFMGVGAVALAPVSLLSGSVDGPWISRLEPTDQDDVVLAKGLSWQVVVRWQDSINRAGEKFGFNNDYITSIGKAEKNALLWVNHEYVDPLFVHGISNWKAQRTAEHILKERKEVGGSFVGLKKDPSGQWKVDLDREEAFRVDGQTKIAFAWPEKIFGSTEAIGTLANCAGGITPWGTVLTCEENFQDYYGDVIFENGKREIKRGRFQWHLADDFPPEHYGWVVEVNPQTRQAKKLIGLGRFAHECATCVRSKDGRVVAYSADDKNDEHLYKFISKSSSNLDEGNLYVADLSKGRWLLLDRNQNAQLKQAFRSQTELLIRTREAAKILGATPLDRPEDIEVDPLTGDVIVACTNNIPKHRFHGSLLKVMEKGGDSASLEFRAETYLMGGQENGFSCPDNLAFDQRGNLWITSDISGKRANKGPYRSFKNNGLFVIPRRGPQAGEVLQVGSAPRGAEFTGPHFYGDTLFLSVQHPGENSPSLEQLRSHWPEGGSSMPKPAVIAIRGPLVDQLRGA